MKIIDATNDKNLTNQMAQILHDGFSDTGTDAWSTLEECLNEVEDSLVEEKISRIAIDEDNKVLAWTIGAEVYDVTWELELLVVRRDSKRKGIGRTMLRDFEEQVLKRGGSTVFLGSDDENNRTSLGGIELYPNPLEHLANIKNIGGHPFEFYQKCGYTITGVIPHANGFGKPDIWMTKQLNGTPASCRQPTPKRWKQS
jgi:aminoglycoside 6'-N-acetyltransferase I